MKILIAPEYAMADLAESHRMSGIAKEFVKRGHEVIILGRGRFDHLFNDPEFIFKVIEFDATWMNEKKFLEIHDLDTYGLNFISEEELDRCVTEEIKVINEIKPDIIITGFRPSLSVTTKITQTQFVWILSGVVSDLYMKHDLITTPHGLSKKFKGIQFARKILGAKLFNKFCNDFIMVPAWCKNWNRIMNKYKLPQFKNALGVLRGDFNLMSDAEELFPEFTNYPEYYDFCGPLLPDLKIESPGCMTKYKKTDRPVIFVSMGSSGDPEILKKLIYCFKGKPYDVFVAITSILKKEDITDIPENVFVEELFPAIELTRMADVAVIHGGQGTVYTTILGGAPFVGIPMFAEQQYNLENTVRNGCGIIIPRTELNEQAVLRAVEVILNNPGYRQKMIKLREKILKYVQDPELNSSKIAAEKILDFVVKNKKSYFAENRY